MNTKMITCVLLAYSLFISFAAFSQGKRDWDERGEKEKRHHDYSYNKYKNNKKYEDKYGNRYDSRGYNRNNNPKVVRYRPQYPTRGYVGRPPSYRHVWIPGEYRWRGGQYVFMPGNWMVPPRKGMNYVPGYWQPSRGGYVWISGFWNNSGLSIRR